MCKSKVDPSCIFYVILWAYHTYRPITGYTETFGSLDGTHIVCTVPAAEAAIAKAVYHKT
jgi:hypothetical protein